LAHDDFTNFNRYSFWPKKLQPPDGETWEKKPQTYELDNPLYITSIVWLKQTCHA